jgi:hypothetical protein
MAIPKLFHPVKLVCGIMAEGDRSVSEAERRMAELFGPIEARGPRVPFAGTDYYRPEMGPHLRRGFVAFRDLIAPERLPDIKIQTNALEEEIRAVHDAPGRVVNLDPGYLTTAALIMATAKDFAHRIPLRNGIYAHLELLFTKTAARRLEWTYPDLRTEEHISFLIGVRRSCLEALKKESGSPAFRFEPEASEGA